MSFKEKYLKYKNKYLELKKQFGGCKNCDDPKCIGGELCENASSPAAIELSSPFEDFLESNAQYVLPFLQYPEGCALGAVDPVTMAMATTVRRWDWPFFVGTKGNGDGQFNTPIGVAISSGGDIFVCDTYNHRIQVFDRRGNYVRQWGKKGNAPGQFIQPTSVAISSSDEVYVCDTFNHRIQVFDLSGNLKKTFGSYGILNGQFTTPLGVIIHDDQVFVSERGRSQVFDLDGNYSGQWGSEGINDGHHLAVSSAGDLVVCDTSKNRVQVFDLKGTFKYSYGDSSPDPKANWWPYRVAISSTNEVFISDNKYSRVLVFTINGTFIRYVELPAGTNGAFMPTGIAVSPNGLVIISDRNNHRIYIMPHGA